MAGKRLTAAPRTQANKRYTNRIARSVEIRLVLRLKRVCGDDAPDIPEPNLPCRADRATVMPTEVHVEPTDDNRHRTVDAHRHHAEGPVLEVVVVMDDDQNGETGDGDADGHDGEGEAVFEFIAEIGDDHGEGEAGGPWGYAV